MITKVIVRSREYLTENLPNLSTKSNHYFISVIDPLAEPLFKEDHSGAVTVRFDDVSPEMFDSTEHFAQICAQMEEYGRPYQIFSEMMANQIIDFVDNLQSSLTEIVLYVHCTLGVSRSGAIATFVAEICGLDGTSFAENNPQIHPNQLVLERLRTAKKKAFRRES
jgi:predicted protein tyrosine phosphatase